MKNLFLYLLLFLLITSCSSPLDKKFNQETSKEDMKEIVASLDSNEVKLLMGSMVRLAFKGEKIEGMTYNEILESGKKWKAEQEAKEAEEKVLAEKAKKIEEERTARLNQALTVTIFDKGFYKVNYQDYITYKFAFENKSQKDITAFTGQLMFTDLFDKEIKKINLTYDDGVKAGSIVNYDATTEYNQFMDGDQLLKSKSLDKIKLVWTPEKILFADGSKLE